MLNKRDQQWFSEMIRNEALKGNSDGPSDDGGRRDDNDGCCDAHSSRTTAAATIAPPRQQISTTGVTQQLSHYGELE